jgi:hypothetical protein
MNLFCSYCTRAFFDGEMLTIRLSHHQEFPMHGECFTAYLEEQREVAAVFGVDLGGDVEFFERQFFDRQVQAETSYHNATEKSIGSTP